MTSSKNVLLIVNFNHEKEIRDVLSRVQKAVAAEALSLDPVVIDDCSTDRSPEIAREMGFKVLRHPENRGVGAAIRTGLQFGMDHGYENVVMIAANGKMQPEEVGVVLRPLLDGAADYVQGSRFKKGGRSDGLSFFRLLAIPIVSAGASLLLRKWFTDITCGFRAYKLNWLRDPDIDLNQSWLNRYELEYYVHYWACRKKLKIVEVPIAILYTHLEKRRRSYIRPFVGWWSMMRPFVYLSLGIKK